MTSPQPSQFTLSFSERTKQTRAIATKLATTDDSTASSKLMLASQLEDMIYKKATTQAEYIASIEKRINKMKMNIVVNDPTDNNYIYRLLNNGSLSLEIKERQCKNSKKKTSEIFVNNILPSSVILNDKEALARVKPGCVIAKIENTPVSTIEQFIKLKQTFGQKDVEILFICDVANFEAEGVVKENETEKKKEKEKEVCLDKVVDGVMHHVDAAAEKASEILVPTKISNLLQLYESTQNTSKPKTNLQTKNKGKNKDKNKEKNKDKKRKLSDADANADSGTSLLLSIELNKTTLLDAIRKANIIPVDSSDRVIISVNNNGNDNDNDIDNVDNVCVEFTNKGVAVGFVLKPLVVKVKRKQSGFGGVGVTVEGGEKSFELWGEGDDKENVESTYVLRKCMGDGGGGVDGVITFVRLIVETCFIFY